MVTMVQSQYVYIVWGYYECQLLFLVYSNYTGIYTGIYTGNLLTELTRHALSLFVRWLGDGLDPKSLMKKQTIQAFTTL